MKKSKYQIDILSAWQESDKNILIEAVAGSGKTTTIQQAIELVENRDANATQIYLVFNARIKAEASKKMKKLNVCISTMHSLGFDIIKKYIGNNKVVPNASKYNNVLNQTTKRVQDIIDESEIEKFIENARKNKSYKEVIDKYWHLIELVDTNFIGLKSKILKFWDIVQNQGITDFSYQNLFNVISVFKKVNTKLLSILCEINFFQNIYTFGKNEILADKCNISFGDMIYYAVVLDNIQTYYPRYDFVYVDECQDLNLSQIKLIQGLRSENNRFMFVGDTYQSIYYFRGSVPNIIESIKKEFDTIVLPLSISYRCPKLITELAQEYVPHLEYNTERNDEGDIKKLDNIIQIKKHAKEGDLVLCRFFAPLLKVYFDLFFAGYKVKMKNFVIDVDIFKTIITSILVNDTDIKSHKRLFEQYQSAQYELVKENETESANLYDKVACMNIIVEKFLQSSNDITIKALSNFIELLKGKSWKKYIVLDTIHSVKGDEADNVFIVGFDDLPIKFKNHNAIERQQEENITYVAITRAKKTLYLV